MSDEIKPPPQLIPSMAERITRIAHKQHALRIETQAVQLPQVVDLWEHLSLVLQHAHLALMASRHPTKRRRRRSRQEIRRRWGVAMGQRSTL